MRHFKFYLLWCLCILYSITSLASNPVFTDGPYIFYTKNGDIRVFDNIIDTVYKSIAQIQDFTVTSSNKNYSFNVSLQKKLFVANQSPIKYNLPDKIFALSDIHGNFEHLIELLQKNEVIDENLNWRFSSNHLVILGDVFDRGNDVITTLWYIYQLEQQAVKVNGMVHYIIGNHDAMTLKNDLRYCKEKYIKLAEKYKEKYSDFFNENSELGRWLRSKNTIQIIGNHLFVHGGISLDFCNSGISINECNSLVCKYISTKRENYPKVAKQDQAKLELLFGSTGPLWYRGLVSNKPKDKPINEKGLDLILNYFNVKHIVVGHTTFNTISQHHNGKVIAIDTKDEKTKHPHLYLGLMIDMK